MRIAREGPADPEHRGRRAGRLALGAFLVAAGGAHLLATDAFLAQVPGWLPLRRSIVVASGVVEIGLGAGLLTLPNHRVVLGRATAGFLAVVTVGNIHQAVAGIDAFGLGTDLGRWSRVAFQPVLIAWALWATRPSHGRRRPPPGVTGRHRSAS